MCSTGSNNRRPPGRLGRTGLMSHLTSRCVAAGHLEQLVQLENGVLSMTEVVVPPGAPSLAARGARALVWVFVPILLVLSVFLYEGSAHGESAYAPPVPIETPPSWSGTAIDTGALATGAGTASVDGGAFVLTTTTTVGETPAGYLVLGAAGAAATGYSLGCQVGHNVLQWFGIDRRCPSSGVPLLDYFTGANGDDRTTSNVVDGTALRAGSNAQGYAGPDGHTGFQFNSKVDQAGNGTTNGSVSVGVVCASGTTYRQGFFPNMSGSNGQVWAFSMLDNAASPGCGGPAVQPLAYGTGRGVTYPSLVRSYFLDYGTCSGSPCASGSTVGQVTSWTRFKTWTFDPAQAWSITYDLTCSGPSGSTSHVTQTTNFTAAQMAASQQLHVPAIACPANTNATNLNVTGGRTSSTGNPDVNINYPAYTTTATTNYPLCTTKAPTGGCWLDLQRNGKSCFDGQTYCAGWMQNEVPWNMTCIEGPYVLNLTICEQAYGTKFDAQPQPTPGPSQAPTPGGQPLPTTGPNPQPSGVPSATMPPDPLPGPGVATNPNSQDCWGQGWSWNPVSWVVVPVECSLKWAFVPSTMPPWTSLSNPLPPGWIPSFPSLTDGGCGPLSFPSMSLGFFGGHYGGTSFVNTCSAPWPLIRSVTYYGGLAAGLIVIGRRAFFAVLTALGMGVQVANMGDE